MSASAPDIAGNGWSILVGDALARLADVPDGSVNCCVTSPPYFGLRQYDKNALRIDPALAPDVREWLVAELERRGIHARR